MEKTPKKIYRRKAGRKPQIVKSADEFCRVCKCALKTKYGSLGSFVNVFKACKREGFQQLVVADLCSRAGIILLKDTALSSRICTTCFRKVCTYSKLFDVLSEAINKPIHVETEEIVVTKRAKEMASSRNAFLVHEPTREDLLIALNRSVNKKISYCRSETILKGRHVDELAAFSNTLVMKETEVYLPLWNACIRGQDNDRRLCVTFSWQNYFQMQKRV